MATHTQWLLIFIGEYIARKHFFRNYSNQIAYKHSLPPPRSTKRSSSNVSVASLFKSGISEVCKITFKSYRIVCRLGKVKRCCIYRHRCFILRKMECSNQLGFALLIGTFHLSPRENILTIALINIHYLYTYRLFSIKRNITS